MPKPKKSVVPGKKTTIKDRFVGIGEIKLDELFPNLLEKFPALTRVSNVEKVTFTKNLSVLIRSGVDLAEAMRILEEQTSWSMRMVIRKIRTYVEAGQLLSQALAEFPHIFSELFVNIIMAGERSGTLDESLQTLSTQLTKSYELRSKIQAAMLYPIIVLSITLFVGVALGIFILPKLSSLFTSLDTELPFTTRMLISISAFLAQYGVWVIIGLILFVVFIVWFLRLPIIKPYVHAVLLRIPLIGTIVRYVNLAVFSRTLSTLLKSGIPITESVTITSRVVANIGYQRLLFSAVEPLTQGQGLSEGLQERVFYFPPLVFRMVKVGEETGKLEDVLEYLADFYETEVDNATTYINTIIEPALLFLIGIILLGVALGIISPIYQVIDAIQQ